LSNIVGNDTAVTLLTVVPDENQAAQQATSQPILPAVLVWCAVSLIGLTLFPNLFLLVGHVFKWSQNQLRSLDFFTQKQRQNRPEIKNRALCFEDIPEFATDESSDKDKILPRFASSSLPKYK
jgi:hypothetical protein